jgi:beta-glucosidase
VNGKPTCAHDELLNDVLRKQWGFDGFVVSDYDAWINLKTTHHYVDTFEEAAAIGINAGMDQEGGFGVYSAVDALPAALAAGTVSASTVKESFRRLMKIRMRLGMFDPPASVAPNNASYTPAIQCESGAHIALARRAVRESIVLLKNKNNVLPLSAETFKGKPGSLAVIGPLADDMYNLLGAANYAFPDGPSKGVVTVLQGLQTVVGQLAAPHVNGCADTACDIADIRAATALSKGASATVLVLGDSFGGKRTGWPLCKGSSVNGCESEAHDRTAIELPGRQAEVAVALAASSGSTPLVCVLLHGGAIALGAAIDACDAIVDMWVPGQEAGAGLADVLFGMYSPAGRSPVTFYHATSDLPDFREYNEYPSGLGRPDGSSSPGITYRHYMGDTEPDFKFGFGLSYTNFSYSGLRTPEFARPCDDLNVTVRVTNIGKVTSDEVVQVYAALPDATVPTPRVRLVAFQRVRDIVPGQSVVVTLIVRPDSHAVVLEGSSVYDADVAVQAGRLALSVGGGQYSYDAGSNTLSGIVQVGPGSAPVRSCGK